MENVQMGDCVMIQFHAGRPAPCEVLYVSSDKSVVRVYRLDKPMPSFLIKVSLIVGFDTVQTLTNRKRSICLRCGEAGIEIGTIGTVNPIYVCFGCNALVDPDWVPPVPVAKKRRTKKVKELVSQKNKTYNAING